MGDGKFRVLNTREIKRLKGMLKEQFEYEFKLDVAFLKKENDIFIITKDIARIDLPVRVNSYGLYFCELKGDKVRLSREGAQIVGPGARKNVVELNEEQLRAYFRGKNIDLDAGNEFVILKYKDDFIACGKGKEGKVLNFLSKSYRSEEVIL